MRGYIWKYYFQNQLFENHLRNSLFDNYFQILFVNVAIWELLSNTVQNIIWKYIFMRARRKLVLFDKILFETHGWYQILENLFLFENIFSNNKIVK
mgnify:CR=1 FL=1